MSSWIGTVKSQNPSMISRGQFGAVALPRLLDLLDNFDIRSSFAVPGHTAYAYPRLIDQLCDRGHEIVHHGWVHENPAAFDEAGERRILELGLEALERVAGVRPLGYRSPAWDLSPRSVDLLTWMLDDFPPAEFVLGMNTGLQAPSTIEENWRADFDFAYRSCPGGLFTLTLHPQTVGRGRYFLMLERLLDYYASHHDLQFETLGDYATRWRTANPLADWIAANPDLTGAHAIEP